MPHHARFLRGFLFLALVGCTEPDVGGARPHSASIAAFDGGVVTREDVQEEAARMPPLLRERFRTEYGKRELAGALMDKRILVLEARRRGFDQRDEIRRQVQQLEEKLIVQALLAEVQAGEAPLDEEQARAWYEEHKASLARPEQVRVARLLAEVPAGADAGRRRAAERRARRWLESLRKGRPFAALAPESDGPERVRGGDTGFIERGGARDADLERAAFQLTEVGQLSPVVEGEGGYMVLQLLERRPARVPSFEEARGEVASRMAPMLQRQSYDALLTELREAYGAGLVPPRPQASHVEGAE